MYYSTNLCIKNITHAIIAQNSITQSVTIQKTTHIVPEQNPAQTNLSLPIPDFKIFLTRSLPQKILPTQFLLKYYLTVTYPKKYISDIILTY